MVRYQAQVTLLTSLLRPKYGLELEIGTVDGMQGREKEAIVISLVRSNDTVSSMERTATRAELSLVEGGWIPEGETEIKWQVHSFQSIMMMIMLTTLLVAMTRARRHLVCRVHPISLSDI